MKLYNLALYENHSRIIIYSNDTKILACILAKKKRKFKVDSV